MKRQVVRRLKSATTRIESQLYDFLPQRRTPRLGAVSLGWAFCQLGNTLNAATGSWPDITPTNTTADLYRPKSGSLVQMATNASILNWRNVTWSASKTTVVLLQGDGSWSVLDQDC